MTTSEHQTWSKEPYQRTFSRENQTQINPQDVSSQSKIDTDAAEFRASRMRLTESTENDKVQSVIAIEFDKAAPFSAITKPLQTKGFVEQILDQDGKKIKRIIIPKEIVDQMIPAMSDNFTPPESEISIKNIPEEELHTGVITLPLDTWNLGNFNEPHYRTDDGLDGSFLNIVHRLYEDLHKHDPNIQKSDLCISKETKQVVVLPRIKKNE